MAKMMTIRPPDDLRQTIKQIARSKGFTVNHIVTQALWDFVDDWERLPTTKVESGVNVHEPRS